MKSDDALGQTACPPEPISAAQPGGAEEIDGLAALFEQARLKGYLSAAEALLQEWGAVDVEEILDDAELLQQLEEHLQLKKLERSRLENAIKARPAPAPAPYLPPVGPASPINNVTPALAVHKFAKDFDDINCAPMMVKNTFIDVEDECPKLGLSRNQTAPPVFKRPLDTTSEEEEQEATSAPGMLQNFNTGMLPRYNTHDDNEVDGTAVAAHLGHLARYKTQEHFPTWEPDNEAWPRQGNEGMYPPEMAHPPVQPLMPPMQMWWSHPMPMMPNWPEFLGPGMMPPVPWHVDPLVPPEPGREPNFRDLDEPQQKRPPTLERTFSVNSGSMRVFWTVPKKKLESKDTHPYLSHEFTLSFGLAFPAVPFKLMITPKVANDAKGGASFKKAKGRGYVELVCEATLPETAPEIQFRIGVGKEQETSKAETRGTVQHNFHQQKVGRLPKDLAEWNFDSAVHEDTKNFVICLEILKSEEPIN